MSKWKILEAAAAILESDSGEVVSGIVSGWVPTRDRTDAGGALRGSSGALEETESAWSARAPWVACFDEAEVRRLGACAQTPWCRGRNVDHRDRSCYGLSGCLVSVGGERKGFPPAAMRLRRAWWTFACALAEVLIQCGESV
ncbi:hypothetical protein NDU88_002829 [Pleurodeles waltl]|uniref:Uncharacterized protein n=1 Tax=Pleurodeles waltl TaxID=8319 RepID=A0AAV7KWJ1_PLEWA|nr:hypothetical protein NDU88_002829 [Pleurodeles waltl]